MRVICAGTGHPTWDYSCEYKPYCIYLRMRGVLLFFFMWMTTERDDRKG